MNASASNSNSKVKSTSNPAGNPLLSGESDAPDERIEQTLRPARMHEFIGQPDTREQLGVFIQAARNRGGTLDHVLVFGPPGLGKTTLAHIVANEMGARLRQTSGPVLEKAGDLAAILTNLEKGDVLFIDEIHRMSPAIEEILYPAMEDYHLDIIIGEGPAARSIRLSLPPFTLVGATTRAGLLTSPLRGRFGIVQRLQFYTADELAQIVERSAKLLEVDYELGGVAAVAARARGTPRIANRLLRRVRDYAEVRADSRLTEATANAALDMLAVDQRGLDLLDREVLLAIMRNFDGGPVGIESIAAAIGEERGTIEDVIEPYLIQQGLLKRTARGREATRAAWQHLHIDMPPDAARRFAQQTAQGALPEDTGAGK